MPGSASRRDAGIAAIGRAGTGARSLLAHPRHARSGAIGIGLMHPKGAARFVKKWLTGMSHPE